MKTKTKTYLESRTFWSIVATTLVLAAEQIAPASWQPYLAEAQKLLMLLGLWFARLGAGVPIAAPKKP